MMDFLCAWNFKHLANALALRRLRKLNEKEGVFVPQVCTPEELLGEWQMQTDPILREVHRVKDGLNREIGGDIEKLIERFREIARQHPNVWPNWRRSQSHEASRGLPTGKPRNEGNKWLLSPVITVIKGVKKGSEKSDCSA
jgi:hypothetical protein